MCGIAGIFDPAGAALPPGLIRRMIGQLHHRGPDDSGIFQDNNIALGSTRLSIFDLSPAGHMPMVDEETGNFIVHNGEVYNFKELIGELGLKNLKSKSDTEVILKAYARLGEKCLDYFNGIFAFAIWNPKTQSLFCARDPLGVKPFLYTRQQGRFLFASEAKSLFAADVPRQPDYSVIRDYLTRGLYEHRARTFFQDISQLEAGHFLTLDRKGMKISRYWDLGIKARPAGKGQPSTETEFLDCCTEFQERLDNAIRLQLRSDTKVAVHVSGGLDSSLLMASINRINGGQKNVIGLTQTYGEEKYDEKPQVDILAGELGWSVDHRRLELSQVPALAREAMWQQEQPFPGIVTLAKQNLIKASTDLDAKVILEGQGGDEIGAGYQYYFGAFIMDLLEAGDAERAIGEIDVFGKVNGLGPEQNLRKLLNGMASYFAPGRSADGSSFVDLNTLSRDFLAEQEDELEIATPFQSNLRNIQYRDIFHTKLPRILRSCDRASMGYGRELRVPLLDKDLVEFTFSLPADIKIRQGEQRSFMRQVLRNIMPATIIDRPKIAVVDPQRDWLKGPLSEWVLDTISSASFAARGLFDIANVKKSYGNYQAQAENENSFHIWQWLGMELWYQEFIDSDPYVSVQNGPGPADAKRLAR